MSTAFDTESHRLRCLKQRLVADKDAKTRVKSKDMLSGSAKVLLKIETGLKTQN